MPHTTLKLVVGMEVTVAERHATQTLLLDAKQRKEATLESTDPLDFFVLIHHKETMSSTLIAATVLKEKE